MHARGFRFQASGSGMSGDHSKLKVFSMPTSWSTDKCETLLRSLQRLIDSLF
jgi:hypothetical protein